MNGIGGCGKLSGGVAAGFFIAAGFATLGGVRSTPAVDLRFGPAVPALCGGCGGRISCNGPASSVVALWFVEVVGFFVFMEEGFAFADFGFDTSSPSGCVTAVIGGKPLDIDDIDGIDGIDDVVGGCTTAGFNSARGRGLCFGRGSVVAGFGAPAAVGSVTGTSRPASIVEFSGVAMVVSAVSAGLSEREFCEIAFSGDAEMRDAGSLGGTMRIGAPSPGCGAAAVGVPTTSVALW